MNRMIRTDAGSRLLEITEDGEVTGDEVVDVKEIAADLQAGFPDSILDVNDFLAQLGEE